jgi:hypothetical protein
VSSRNFTNKLNDVLEITKRNRRNGKNDMRKKERDRRKVEKKNIPNVRLSRKQF